MVLEKNLSVLLQKRKVNCNPWLAMITIVMLYNELAYSSELSVITFFFCSTEVKLVLPHMSSCQFDGLRSMWWCLFFFYFFVGYLTEKSLFYYNPLMPHLQRRLNDDMSHYPTPYKLMRSMLMSPGSLSGYTFYRIRPESAETISKYQKKFVKSKVIFVKKIIL